MPTPRPARPLLLDRLFTFVFVSANIVATLNLILAVLFHLRDAYLSGIYYMLAAIFFQLVVLTLRPTR